MLLTAASRTESVSGGEGDCWWGYWVGLVGWYWVGPAGVSPAAVEEGLARG